MLEAVEDELRRRAADSSSDVRQGLEFPLGFKIVIRRGGREAPHEEIGAKVRTVEIVSSTG